MGKTFAGHYEDYQSYLLRLWHADTAWRASLENPHTGEQINFACLEQLFVFLMEQTERARQGGVEDTQEASEATEKRRTSEV